MPASMASSSRRSPGVRRRPPAGNPISAGERRSRRLRRKLPSLDDCTITTIIDHAGAIIQVLTLPGNRRPPRARASTDVPILGEEAGGLACPPARNCQRLESGLRLARISRGRREESSQSGNGLHPVADRAYGNACADSFYHPSGPHRPKRAAQLDGLCTLLDEVDRDPHRGRFLRDRYDRRPQTAGLDESSVDRRVLRPPPQLDEGPALEPCFVQHLVNSFSFGSLPLI